MEKRIIKIDAKNQVVSLIPDDDGKMYKTTYKMEDFFSMWLSSVCEKGVVSNFSFKAADSVQIHFLNIESFFVGEKDIQLVLDETALDNEYFMGQLRYIEKVFLKDKDKWQREFAARACKERERVEAANTCFGLLRKLCAKESIGDIDEIKNPHLVLAYFYSHKETIRKYAYSILTDKMKKMSNRFSIFSATVMTSAIVSFFGLMVIVLLWSFGISFPTIIALVLGGVCGISFMLSMVVAILGESSASIDIGYLDEVLPRFVEEIEKSLVMGKKMTKRDRFENFFAKTRSYMSLMDFDFTNEESAISEFLGGLEEKKNSTSNERLEEIANLLHIEWQIYSKESGVGRKESCFYTDDDITDMLDYIELSQEEMEDGLLCSMVDTIDRVIEEPFYGCELEITRLLIGLVNYLRKIRSFSSYESYCQSNTYDTLHTSYHNLIEETLNKKNRANQMEALIEAKVAVTDCTQKTNSLQTISGGMAMQIKPIEQTDRK